VLVDAGPSPAGPEAAASTIVDVTGRQPRLLRLGALGLDQLNAVLEPLELALPADTEGADVHESTEA